MALIKNGQGQLASDDSPSAADFSSSPSVPKSDTAKNGQVSGIGIALEPDAPDAPPQRGSITPGRANVAKLQLWLADNLRKTIAPNVPLDLPLERTPEREKRVVQRFAQVMQRANVKIPPNVSEQIFMAAVDLPIGVVRRQIASAIHLIVQASRLRDGSRKVTQITEVQGMEGETVILTDIYKFQDQGDGPDGKVAGEHQASGLPPQCLKIFKQHGYDLPPAIFMS